MKKRLDSTRYFRCAFFRLLLEGGALLIVLALLGAGGGYAARRCWFGLLGPDPVNIVKRYYRVGDRVQHVDENREWTISQQEITHKDAVLGVELALNKECHCSDLFAEAHYYTNDAGGLVEERFEIRRLLPSNGDIRRLEGRWAQLQLGSHQRPKRYRVEMRLACGSQPQDYIDHFWYATVIIRT